MISFPSTEGTVSPEHSLLMNEDKNLRQNFKPLALLNSSECALEDLCMRVTNENLPLFSVHGHVYSMCFKEKSHLAISKHAIFSEYHKQCQHGAIVLALSTAIAS